VNQYTKRQIARIATARGEARRFIKIADAAIAALGGQYPDTRATAAAKRASMDLTRALVGVRKSPYND
jgi:hypothetical protein